MQTSNKFLTELFMLDRNTWNRSTVCKQMSFGLFKVTYKLFIYKSHILNRHINKIWHEITYKSWYTIKPNQPTILFAFAWYCYVAFNNADTVSISLVVEKHHISINSLKKKGKQAIILSVPSPYISWYWSGSYLWQKLWNYYA